MRRFDVTPDNVQLTGLVRAMVEVFGRATVAEALKSELRRRPGPDSFDTFMRQVSADRFQEAEPTLTRYAAVMLVLDEEEDKKGVAYDRRARDRIFDQVYQRDRTQRRKWSKGDKLLDLMRRDDAIDQEAARFRPLIELIGEEASQATD